MNVCETYSHLNGLEFLLVHKPDLWREVLDVIASIDAASCKTKVSKEKRTPGKLLYSPVDMNAQFKQHLHEREWEESRVNYWVTQSERLIRKTMTLNTADQKKEIEKAGETPIFSYNQTYFAKNRVAVEV